MMVKDEKCFPENFSTFFIYENINGKIDEIRLKNKNGSLQNNG